MFAHEYGWNEAWSNICTRGCTKLKLVMVIASLIISGVGGYDIKPLAPGRGGSDFKNAISPLILHIHIVSTSHGIARSWIQVIIFDDKSTLVQVMTWCHQTSSHYSDQSWPSSMLPYNVTSPQWVNNYNARTITLLEVWDSHIYVVNYFKENNYILNQFCNSDTFLKENSQNKQRDGYIINTEANHPLWPVLIHTDSQGSLSNYILLIYFIWPPEPEYVAGAPECSRWYLIIYMLHHELTLHRTTIWSTS